MKPIKIAILSCNHGHAKSYYNLQSDPFFELVGVSVAPGYENKVGLKRLTAIPTYKTDKELYDNHPELEAVVIASENKSHMRQVREAVARGLHIFSMKIPTFDMDEYREMMELTHRSGVVFMVELEMRHHAPLDRVKELITEGCIGDLLSVNMINYSHNPVWWRPWQCNPEDSYGRRVRLRAGDYRFRGGALADHPHLFDALRYITNSSFSDVYAEVAPNPRIEVETEDMIRIIGRLNNGVIFSIDPSYANNEHRVDVQVDWIKYPRPVEVFMSATGTKGVIIADLYGKTYCFQGKQTGEYFCSGLGAEGLGNKRMREFYECVREGARPMVGLPEHYDSIVAMNAAYESVSTGQRVVICEEK